jgi:hypothetical protein
MLSILTTTLDKDHKWTVTEAFKVMMADDNFGPTRDLVQFSEILQRLSVHFANDSRPSLQMEMNIWPLWYQTTNNTNN